MTSLRAAISLSVLIVSVAPAALAQARAPISYLGQGAPAATRPAAPAPAAAPVRVAALSDSYNYGAQQRAAQGGLLDLTRPSNRPASRDPDLLSPPADPEELRNEPDGPEETEIAYQPAPERPRPTAPAAQQPEQRPAWLERERVGPPYEVNGRTYVPTPEPGYEQTGLASWYGPDFHGRQTANGETYDQEGLTAAHPTLPLNSLVQVTNVSNGREAIVRINDRGPFVGDRLIDLSRRTGDVLGFEGQGTARVHVRYLGPAPRRFGAGEGAPLPATTANAAPMQVAQVRSAEPFIGTPLRPTPSSAPLTQAAPPVEGAGGVFVVQVGAFSDLSNAHRVRSALETAGDVLVEPRQTANGEVFRVRVVGYGSRAAAEAGRAQVASLGFPEAIVAAR